MDKAENNIVLGSTGTGKTTWLMAEILKEKRVIVWDPKNEYCRDKKNRFKRVESIPELCQLLKKKRAGRFALTVDVNRENWELCNAAVLAWGNCVYVTEEIGDVTTQGKAPPMWGRIIRRGRDRDVKVFAVVHRFPEIDTTTRGNVSRWHIHSQQRKADRENTAKELDVSPEVLILKDYSFVQWTKDGGIKRGMTKKTG